MSMKQDLEHLQYTESPFFTAVAAITTREHLGIPDRTAVSRAKRVGGKGDRERGIMPKQFKLPSLGTLKPETPLRRPLPITN
jgi:hypothetical protein